MPTVQLQLSDVIYNAASQTFEALVTVHDAQGARSYACAINAPIDMEFEEAAARLAAQAKRRDTTGHADSTFLSVAAPSRTDQIMAHLRRMTVPPFNIEHPRAA